MLLGTGTDDALVALCCGLLLVGLALYVLPHLAQTGAPPARPLRHVPTTAGASARSSVVCHVWWCATVPESELQAAVCDKPLMGAVACTHLLGRSLFPAEERA